MARASAPTEPGEPQRPAAQYLGRLEPPEEALVADLPRAEATEPDTVAEVAPDASSLPPAVRRDDEIRAELPAAGVSEPEKDLKPPEKPIPEDAVITLEPAEARPPEKTEEPPEVTKAEPPTEPAPAEEPTPEPAAEPEPVPERDRALAPSLPVVARLESDRYYLQIGAYTSAGSAKAAIERLGEGYPTEVLADDADDRTLYRVLVGPLNEDERGSMLYLVRAMGYRDAFIREGDES
jgi:cell division protein FtsN